MRDAKGSLIPIENIRAADQLEDETVRKIMAFAEDLSAQIRRFREHTFADLNGVHALYQQDYGAKAGGEKGNVTFQTFDGLKKVQVQIANLIEFGPQLQQAKALIDECLKEWGAESRPEIRALVNRVFNVDQAGQINKAELFSLLRMEILDERWVSAMKAIRDAIRITGTKEYVRFYMRSRPNDEWRAVAINIAAA
ncbi:DUF3164 family protein [Bosea sp. 685]|uniref:DUF3164 family protein n=1 Tax=Bosea sp. 685 TaxID=3080057 RepID=UPI0028937586|nr:DUF3164 family protein [Bosea sp. 685]WNJ93989.1 DUF3164 family protein [Bosea sp. 685]